jgi:hypothetical protein
VDRRAFIGTLAGGLLAAPLAAAAQRPEKIYRIGSLSTSPVPVPGKNPVWDSFLLRMRELGYIEGQGGPRTDSPTLPQNWSD